jgi:hypothetical protein
MSTATNENGFFKIYNLIMMIVFTMVCLVFTDTWDGSNTIILKNRFFFSFFFLIPGAIVYKFRNIMLKIFYERDGLKFKDETSKEKILNRTMNIGKTLLLTGIVINILGIFLYFFPILPNLSIK